MVTKAEMKRFASDRYSTLKQLQSVYVSSVFNTATDICRMHGEETLVFEDDTEMVIENPRDPDNEIGLRSVYFDGQDVKLHVTDYSTGTPDTIPLYYLRVGEIMKIIGIISGDKDTGIKAKWMKKSDSVNNS